MVFVSKLNKRDSPYVISNEVFTLASGKAEGFLAHDNVIDKSLEVYTLPDKGGERVLSYVLDKIDGFEWRQYIKIFSSAEVVYVFYECYGDMVEAEDVNVLQGALVDLDNDLKANIRDLATHKIDEGNPHKTTKGQTGLSEVDNTSDKDKPVSVLQREAMDDLDRVRGEQDKRIEAVIGEHKGCYDNPHGVTKGQVGLPEADNTSDIDKPVSLAQRMAMDEILSVQQEADSGLDAKINMHRDNFDNPHLVNKIQVGLSEVDNIKQASEEVFNAHDQDTIKHLTTAERSGWGDKYTKNEVDNKFATLETAVDWKESVGTFDDIDVVYPTPLDGWTVNVLDTDYTYRYSGSAWVAISANAIPKATQGMDGLLSKEDKTNFDDANVKKHEHSNKGIIDKITQGLLDNWGAAFGHISDSIRHITGGERANWDDANTKKHEHANKGIIDRITQELLDKWDAVVNKVDKVAGKGLSTNDYSVGDKDKLAGIAAGANLYVHPASHPASVIVQDVNNRFVTDAQKNEWSAKAPASHGLHVPPVQSPSNAVYLRNDNTWQTIVPAEIGAMDSGGTIPFTAGVQTNGSVYVYDNVYSGYNPASSVVGILKIALPFGVTSTMLTLEITGYNYSTNTSWRLIVSGYNYSSGWINCSAFCTNSNAPFKRVRFGFDGDKRCILLGEVGTGWSYPHFVITKVMAGYSTMTGWRTGWSHTFVTAETGLTLMVDVAINEGLNSTGGNADTLDGLDSSKFARKDANNTIAGVLTSTVAGKGTYVGNWSGVNYWGIYGGTNPGVHLRVCDVNGVLQPGAIELYLGDGVYKVWHQGNDGSGSGLDADTLDGLHAADFTAKKLITLAQLNDANLKDGIYNIESAELSTVGLPGQFLHVIVGGGYSNNTGGYGAQLAIPYQSGIMQGVWYRVASGGTYPIFKRVDDWNNIVNKPAMLPTTGVSWNQLKGA